MIAKRNNDEDDDYGRRRKMPSRLIWISLILMWKSRSEVFWLCYSDKIMHLIYVSQNHQSNCFVTAYHRKRAKTKCVRVHRLFDVHFYWADGLLIQMTMQRIATIIVRLCYFFTMTHTHTPKTGLISKRKSISLTWVCLFSNA